MSLFHSPNVVTNGLVLYYDMNNTKKSFKGAPTTNFITSPEDFSNGSYWDKTTYPVTVNANVINAPDNTLTGDLLLNGSGLIIQGIATSTTGTGQLTASVYVKYHSASYFTLNCYYNGDTEVNISFNPSTGTCDAGGTMTYTGNGWYRCSHQIPARVNAGTTVLFRVWPGGRGVGGSLGCYFWGAQLETGSYVTPYVSGTRSNTQALIDLTGNNTITANSLTYASNNTFSFNGSSNVCTIPNNTIFDTQTPTVEVWMKTNALTQNGFWFEKGTVNTEYSLFQEGANIVWRQYFSNTSTLSSLYATSSSFINTSNYFQIVGTYESGNRRLYVNSNLANSDTQTGTINYNANGMTIGSYNSGGYFFNGTIAIIKVYNRALSANEVKQNFNALKGRFDL